MSQNQAASSRCWPARNLTGAFVLILCFLVFNLVTYNYYPAVWCDEVFYSEPAVNFAQTGSFHTYVSYVQPSGTFSVANCPGYFLALGPWIKIFGGSLFAIRAFNYLLMASATALLCLVLLRFGFLQSKWPMLAFVAVLHLGYGMSFAYRCSRPDVLGMNCIVLSILAFTLQNNSLRLFSLFGLACVSVWIGVPIGVFMGFAILTGWLLLPWVRWKEVLVVALGGIISTGSLLLFIASKGLLQYFMVTVFALVGRRYEASPTTESGFQIFKIIAGTMSSYVDDFSTVPLVFGVVVLALKFWKPFSYLTRRMILYLMCLVVGTPLFFNLTGHWAFYYSYMKFIPAVLALWIIGVEINHLSPQSYRRWFRPVATTMAILAMLVGLPLRFCVVWSTSTLAPRAEIKKIVSQHIISGDVVFSEYEAFFETKQLTHIVYDHWSSRTLQISRAEGRDLTAEERAAVSAMIIRPKDAARLAQFMGGEWQPVTPPFGDRQNFDFLNKLPIIGKRFASYASQPQSERFEIQIFRRAPLPGVPQSP